MIMNKLKFRQHHKRLICTIAAVITLVAVLITGVQTYAASPDAVFIAAIHGSGLQIGTGGTTRRVAQKNDRLQGRNVLYVPGNGSWVQLGFVVDGVNDYDGLMVQAGPHSTPSEWTFPCTGRAGSFAIAWRRGNNRGCEAGSSTKTT